MVASIWASLHVAADRRHLLAAVPDQLLRDIVERPSGDRRRLVGSLALHAVALRADALEGLFADRTLPCVCVARNRRYSGFETASTEASHERVLRAAELGALSGEQAGTVGLEPRVVRPAGDGVDLAAERGDPPAVDHVGGDDLDVHDLVRRDDHVVDRHLGPPDTGRASSTDGPRPSPTWSFPHSRSACCRSPAA